MRHVRTTDGLASEMTLLMLSPSVSLSGAASALWESGAHNLRDREPASTHLLPSRQLWSGWYNRVARRPERGTAAGQTVLDGLGDELLVLERGSGSKSCRGHALGLCMSFK